MLLGCDEIGNATKTIESPIMMSADASSSTSSCWCMGWSADNCNLKIAADMAVKLDKGKQVATVTDEGKQVALPAATTGHSKSTPPGPPIMESSESYGPWLLVQRRTRRTNVGKGKEKFSTRKKGEEIFCP